jgi:hypothetical protein
MKRPITISLAAFFVLALLLISAVWPLVGGDQLLGLNRGGTGRTMPQGGLVPQGTPSGDQGNIPQDGQGQNPAGLGNFSGNGGQPQMNGSNFPNQNGTMQFTRILQYVLYALVIVLGLIAFGGLWAWKRWGMVMAIITAAVVLIMTITGLFRAFSTIVLIEDIVKILLAIAEAVLVLLPKSKPIQAITE